MDETKAEANPRRSLIERISVENSRSNRKNCLRDSSTSNVNDSDDTKIQSYSSSTGQTKDALRGRRGRILSQSSGNIVTAATASTSRNSSSLECQDTNHTATTATASSGSGCEGMALPKAHRDGLPPRKKARLHHDDGSTLQVPGDDGSDRIVAGDIEGGVPIKPATVVASRLFTPHTIGSKISLLLSSTVGTGAKRRSSPQTSAQNQPHLLLPPHREPRYHTIRNTLYRFRSNANGNNHSHRNTRSKKRRSRSADKIVKDNKDPPSTDESPKDTITITNTVAMGNHHHHHRSDRRSGSISSDRSSAATASTNVGSMKSKDSTLPSSNFSILQQGNTGGNFSGSGSDGTEDGYAGSVSSNENGSGNQQLGSSSPSPSETSSEECEQQAERHKANRHWRNNNSKQKSSRGTQEGDDSELSSDIADFSSSVSSETMDEDDVGNGRRGGEIEIFGTKAHSSSSSPSLSSPNQSDSGGGGLEMAYLSAKREADAEHNRMLQMITRKKRPNAKDFVSHTTSVKRPASRNLEDGRPPILAMGCDVMAHVLTFLNPPEILDVLTMPLSKLWLRNFTSQPELWRVLCLVEPFKAIMDDPAPSRSNKDKGRIGKNGADSLSDETYCSFKTGMSTEKLLDKYRLLYTSFVRCMKYVTQIRDDAINGRPPAYIDYGISGTISSSLNVHPVPPPPTTLSSNRNLQLFLAKAKGIELNSSKNDNSNNSGGESKNNAQRSSTIFPARVGTAHRKNELMKKNKNQEKKNGPKFGRSMITSRLLAPVEGNEANNLNLPWSCAIYSIVNWMVAFSDVEGLQTLCLKVLPVLLENEQHRLTAQHAGLADVVLRAMVMFSKSAQLHIAAFHTIVLLARPHGGSEGMMFRNSMTADGIFRGIYQRHGKSGIAVMLDSMRRFQDNATLLAMSCWALVNIALVSDQKAVLVKLGGIQAITNAMYRHPFSAELQFRALFALINLVIPSVQNNGSDNNIESENSDERADVAASQPEQLGELNETSEKEIIDELVGDIASLVVHVMKNFCSSEAILNRACLVLHNLSLTDEYHVILLWTPQCYQMLEWCVANFRSDHVLQQSATGTLHRLQSTLASDEQLRSRFSKSLQTQQQHVNLKQAQLEIL